MCSDKFVAFEDSELNHHKVGLDNKISFKIVMVSYGDAKNYNLERIFHGNVHDEGV